MTLDKINTVYFLIGVLTTHSDRLIRSMFNLSPVRRIDLEIIYQDNMCLLKFMFPSTFGDVKAIFEFNFTEERYNFCKVELTSTQFNVKHFVTFAFDVSKSDYRDALVGVSSIFKYMKNHFDDKQLEKESSQ